MTSLPETTSPQKLGLVIDLDICVGCHACAVNCKEWNAGGHSAPMTDWNSYSGHETLGDSADDAGAWGVWFNRIHAFEVSGDAVSRTVYFPRSCLHCETPDCVTVCPTGASYKREEDGIVLVNADVCIGCKLCSWACAYGAREYDQDEGVMKKCTLCVDRIYNDNLEERDRVPACVSTCPAGARHFGDLGDPTSEVSRLVADRGGYDLMPEMGFRPTNKYLPPRPQKDRGGETGAPLHLADLADRADAPKQSENTAANRFLNWVDAALSSTSTR